MRVTYALAVRRHRLERKDVFLTSIIIPCRNEQEYIGQCLDSILANDYPKDRLEVLVVDGMSEDGTRATVESYAREQSVIKLLDNSAKITPAALNVGIANAKGDVIMRIDAHAQVARDYISRCVEGLHRYGADNIGGIMKTVPDKSGLIGKAVVASLSYRFGVGNSFFRIQTRDPKWVDTVFGGCYGRNVFDWIGPFNEKLPRGQDMEFNLRLKKAGGRTLLVPDIVSYYYARSDIRSFCKHNWSNGVWAILPLAYSDIIPVSWRHFVPLVFVTSLLGSALLGLLGRPFLWLSLTIVGAYGLASLIASFEIAWRERDLRYLILMPFIFGMLHIGYGLGSLWGLVKLLSSPGSWKKILGTESSHETARE